MYDKNNNQRDSYRRNNNFRPNRTGRDNNAPRSNGNNRGPFSQRKSFPPRNLIKVDSQIESPNMPAPLEVGKLRVIPIGGVEKIGINTMAIEYDKDLIIVDMGFGFPSDKQAGVDYVIPNYSYVKDNIDKLRGVVITHGHMDHIGAIPYVIKDLGNPTIYAGKLATELIKEKCEEFAIQDSVKIQEVTSVSKYNLGVFEISYFRVNHNIPDSFGLLIKTPVGNIVHTGDFKFDLTPYREPVTEFAKIANAGADGVLLLCSDSTNACEAGWSDSESSVTEDLTRLIDDAKGRVITATFSTLITRMAQIIEIAHNAGRKVVMSGRSIETTVRIAKELGLIKVPIEAFINSDQARNMPDNELLIMATGSQGEEFAALNRMANGVHTNFDIKAGDTVILSSSFIPGNEGKIHELIAKLSKKQAIVYNSKMMDVHASGHAGIEDHKMLLHLCKPKYLMPIHGDYVQLLGQKTTAIKVGMDPNNVILTENGTTVDFSTDGTFRIAGKVNAYPLLVDGFVMGDITPAILEDRQKLGEEGVIVNVINSDKHITIVSRGLMEVKESQGHIDAITDIVKSHLEGNNDMISKLVGDYIRERIGRNPLVMTVRKEAESEKIEHSGEHQKVEQTR